MTNRTFPGEHRGRSSASDRVMALCRAIFEDTEDARQYRYQGRNALDLHNTLPSAPTSIRHGSHPLPSELTDLIA